MHSPFSSSRQRIPRVIFMGTPAFSVAIAKHLLVLQEEGLLELVASVTRNDRPEGRSKQPKASPLKEFILKEQQGALFECARVAHLYDSLRALESDLILVAAFGQILPQSVLDLPRLGSWNVHTSLLPRWRGAAPIQRAILEGDACTGVTLMEMVAALDAGALLSSATVPLPLGTSYGVLEEKLSEQARPLLRDWAQKACLAIATAQEASSWQWPLRSQNEDEVTWAKKIEKEEAKVDCFLPCAQVARTICALDPKPGAFALLGDAKDSSTYGGKQGRKRAKLFGIDQLFLESLPSSEQPGSMVEVSRGSDRGTACAIVCGDGLLIPREILVEGSKRLPFASWLRGLQQEPGSLRFY